LRISLKNGNFVKISKTTLLEILIKQHARCGNIGPHIKFGGLSFANTKVVTDTLFPASIGFEIRQGITFLFVNDSPSNLICKPIYANPTNGVL